MKAIQKTATFARWYKKLRGLSRVVVDARILRMEEGHLGDTKPVGDGVYGVRIHVAGGIRLYFVERRGEMIILLAGGDKSSQRRDIETAKMLSKEL